MTGQGVPGVSVEATVTVTSWAELGEHLAFDCSGVDQTDFIGSFAEVMGETPIATAVLAERILLAEKDDPEARVVREAVQRFCRELLEHLDEGSR